MEETQIKTDCFGYSNLSKKQECRILNELLCAKGKCPFYKTQWEYEKGNKKCDKYKGWRESFRDFQHQ